VGVNIFKPRLNGFSLLKRDPETVPEKELFSIAPIAHTPPEQSPQKKIGV
jgi:hypothetical protein